MINKFKILIYLFVFTFINLFSEEKINPVIKAKLVEDILIDELIINEELESISNVKEISFLINLIYAKNGYVFNSKNQLEYFKQFSWYKPKKEKIKFSENDLINLKNLQSHFYYLKFSSITNKKLESIRNKKNDVNLNSLEIQFVGIWQDGPVINSGWSDTYTFFPNRIIIKSFNQMDCEKRLFYRIGNWKILNQKLIIEYFAKVLLLNGEKVEGSGSCATDFEIEGGYLKYFNLKKNKIQKLKVSRIQIDNDWDKPLVKIGEERFWKLRSNPNKYY